MTKHREQPLASIEQMHHVGQLLAQMKPAFERMSDLAPAKIRFMHLAKALPIKHDGNVYAIHAAMISQCAKDIMAIDGGAKVKKKVWKHSSTKTKRK